MKFKCIFSALAAALITGCSDNLDKGGAYNPENGVIATIPGYSFDNGTRVNISDDLQTFTWSDNDELGIYYTDDNAHAQAGFTIRQGGSSTGVFSNDIFYLNPEKTYYAFYPYNSGFTTTTAEVDFAGQTQTANASAAHLGAYNYMYGNVTINNKSANVNFNNLGAVIAAKLTVPTAAVYKSLTITSDNALFTTKGTSSMVNGAVTASESSQSITLSLGNAGISLEANSILTAYLLASPVDMSGSTLTFTLTDESGNSSELTMEGKNMLAGKAYLYEGTYIVEDDTPYVTFTAEAEQTFNMSNAVATLEYSVNGGVWTELGTSEVTFGGAYGDLRLRGKSSTGTGSSVISFGNETKVACSGDIRSLIDYANYNTTNTGNATFQNLFDGCSSLISAPSLPSINLAEGCYQDMFKECISLVSAPELPATTLVPFCYKEMFYGCKMLTTLPNLPAMSMQKSCYYGMFRRCSSLVEAPELPALTMAEYCYKEMFSGCTSLKEAPSLPAMSLAGQCYASMFSGCTSLVEAPELPATAMAGACYYHMFNGCTSLLIAPELPAMSLEQGCYSNMFNNCSSLTVAPELPATELKMSCYSAMFANCISLKDAPSLPSTTLADQCYNAMFWGCKELVSAPILPAKTLPSRCYWNMFNSCPKLNYICMMATNIKEGNSLQDWVTYVASSGTFVKAPSMTSLPTGNSGIPSGWTVVDYTDSTGPDMSGSDMGGDW